MRTLGSAMCCTKVPQWTTQVGIQSYHILIMTQFVIHTLAATQRKPTNQPTYTLHIKNAQEITW